MKRKNFLTAVLAALGVSATGPVFRPSKGVPVSTPTSPPALSFPSILELERLKAQYYARHGHHATRFAASRDTFMELMSTVSSRRDWPTGGGFEAFNIAGLTWVEENVLRRGVMTVYEPWYWDMTL